MKAARFSALLLVAGCGADSEGTPPPDGQPDRCDGVSPTLPLSAPGSVTLTAYGNPVPYPAANPYSYEKALLGKILFWEEQLSSDDTVACGTCHRPAAGGSDPRAVTARHPGADGDFGSDDDVHGSPGIVRCRIGANGEIERLNDPTFARDPQVTGRKAPSFMDAMFYADLFWDGRATSTFTDPETQAIAIGAGGALESQAVGPPLNSGEMACEGRTWADVRNKLAAAEPLALASQLPAELLNAVCAYPTYGELFELAFGDPAISAQRIAFAIATYERTLVSNETPLDVYQAGDATALTARQQQGLTLANSGLPDGAACMRCHPSPNLALPGTPGTFINIGFVDRAWDEGRYNILSTDTRTDADRGKFKTPTARNVGLREAGGLLHHGGLHGESLERLMAAYNNPPIPPGSVTSSTDPRMIPLGLTDPEITALIDFMRNGLTDPRAAEERYPFDRPKLSTED